MAVASAGADCLQAPPEPVFRILKPGRNCWRVEPARHVAVLTNGEYFRVLAAALAQAEQEIILIGWDLDARIVLDPENDGPAGRPLHQFLDHLLARRPGLRISCLLWRRPLLYGANRNALEWLEELRRDHPTFAFHRRAAPLGACHHQKLIVIDGALAFVGGIDLTNGRWDRPNHPAVEPSRHDPDGTPYGPVRDIQMAVDGAAATALADFARVQWIEATGDILPVPERRSPCWPVLACPDFADIPVAIARTRPGAAGEAVREIEALTCDALASARSTIYIEAQYLTADVVGDILEQQLRRWSGPRIVVIVTRRSRGMVERLAMGSNRDRLVRRLRAADRHLRLRVYSPCAVGRHGVVDLKIHSKLIVVDDRFLRVGSSNLNNRSMRLDTECDLAIEATDAASRAGIVAIRDRLLAELLCQSREAVAAAVRAHDLMPALDRLDGGRQLCRIPALPIDGATTPMPGTALLDPVEPISLRYLWRAVSRGGPGGASRIAARSR